MAGHRWESGVETSLAVARGITDYWTGALRRGATPLDGADDAVR
ncbi:MAG: hypothetical protein QOF37_1661, partial [Thermoleophilaceae bacterium]|nr:hypothetical protein [Thermoleophilaceae bacterium]